VAYICFSLLSTKKNCLDKRKKRAEEDVNMIANKEGTRNRTRKDDGMSGVSQVDATHELASTPVQAAEMKQIEDILVPGPRRAAVAQMW
jgi:hypothetical protein